jgi:hypothetical protein
MARQQQHSSSFFKQKGQGRGAPQKMGKLEQHRQRKQQEKDEKLLKNSLTSLNEMISAAVENPALFMFLAQYFTAPPTNHASRANPR